VGRTKLVCEPGVGSGEWGKKKQGAWIVIRNPKIKKFHQKFKKLQIFFLNSNFSENLDLLPWVQDNLNRQKWKKIW
jgi:hypothetical protein